MTRRSRRQRQRQLARTRLAAVLPAVALAGEGSFDLAARPRKLGNRNGWTLGGRTQGSPLHGTQE